FITIHNPREHNLKGMAVKIPLGTFTCVTGVSGSGKSTLVNDILYRALASMLHRAQDRPRAHDRIEGAQRVDNVADTDQSPLRPPPPAPPEPHTGVSPSPPALRPPARGGGRRGSAPGRFSSNVRGGGGAPCRGGGFEKTGTPSLPASSGKGEV